MRLSCSWVSIHYYITSLAYKVKCLELREKIPAVCRKFFSYKFLEILHLRKVSLSYAAIFPVLNALLDLSIDEDPEDLSIVTLANCCIGNNVI